jgi:hypothetical protein
VNMIRNCEVMLGQMLNHYVVFCNYVQCLIFVYCFVVSKQCKEIEVQYCLLGCTAV